MKKRNESALHCTARDVGSFKVSTGKTNWVTAQNHLRGRRPEYEYIELRPTCLGPQQSRASTSGGHYDGDAAAAVGAQGVPPRY
jgi:hypothetical protein